MAYEEALGVEAQVDALFEGVGSQSRGRSRSAASHTPTPWGKSRGTSTPGKGTRDTASPLKRKIDALRDEEEFVPESEVLDSPRVQAARGVVELFEQVFPYWQDLLEIKGDIDRPKSLQRFDYGGFSLNVVVLFVQMSWFRLLGHILTRVICKGSYALGILKEYERELEVLEALLAQKRWRRGRRGRWHERRALILMTHMDKDPITYQRATTAVIEGLEDEDTHISE